MYHSQARCGAHAFNLNSQEAEAVRSLSSRTASVKQKNPVSKKSHLGKKGFISVYSSTTQSTTEGSKGKNSRQGPAGGNWSRGHGKVLLTGLSFMAPRTSCPGIAPPTVNWVLRTYYQLKKRHYTGLHTASLEVDILSVEVPSS